MKTMNKIYSLSLVICLLFCTSCEKEMITYSGDSAVYFPISIPDDGNYRLFFCRIP